MISLLLLGQIVFFVGAAKDDILDFINHQHMGKLFGDGVSEYEITTPIRTDQYGNRIHRFQRSTDRLHPHEVFFNVDAFGDSHKLQLQKNSHLIDDDFNFTSRNEDGTVNYLAKNNNKHCVYHGVHDFGSAALVTCNGLFGMVRTSKGDFFIQPLPEHLRKNSETDQIQHVVFKRRQTGGSSCGLKRQASTSSSVVDDLVEEFSKNPNVVFVDKNKKPIGGKPYGDNYKGPKNAASADRLTIETAIFLDKEIMDYMQKMYPTNTDHETLSYVFAIMNCIQLIYNEPNFIGKPVEFVIIKIEFFKTDDVGFQKTDNGDQLLENFCEWQSTQNVESDYDEKHWDHAFMFTGVDLKDEEGNSQVIGIAPLARMCTPRESCTLTEANSFIGLYTAAHECGHNFAMPHDGDGNECDSHKYIMAPLDEIGQNTWSTCSTSYAKKYTKIPWSQCMLDKRKVIKKYDHTHSGIPGQVHTADEQCELRLGPGGMHDSDQPLEDVCPQLKCKKGNAVQTAQPAIEGTYCGHNKVCKYGECVTSSGSLKKVDGGWGEWTKETTCNSGCVKHGVGIQASFRKCDNPRPNNGGKFCEGDALKLKTCSENCHKRKSLDHIGKEICKNAPEKASKQYSLTGQYWQNFDDDTKGCYVWCEIEGGQYITWNANFPDGVSCSNGHGSKYCYKGTCSEVSKDESNDAEKLSYPEILEFVPMQDNIVLTTLAGDPNDIHSDGIHTEKPKYLGAETLQVQTANGSPNDIHTDGIHQDN